MAEPGKRIKRTRTGCFTCRRRKTKCDEGKPTCQKCSRLNLECAGYDCVKFRNDTALVVEKVAAIEARKRADGEARRSKKKDVDYDGDVDKRIRETRALWNRGLDESRGTTNSDLAFVFIRQQSMETLENAGPISHSSGESDAFQNGNQSIEGGSSCPSPHSLHDPCLPAHPISHGENDAPSDIASEPFRTSATSASSSSNHTSPSNFDTPSTVWTEDSTHYEVCLESETLPALARTMVPYIRPYRDFLRTSSRSIPYQLRTTVCPSRSSIPEIPSSVPPVFRDLCTRYCTNPIYHASITALALADSSPWSQGRFQGYSGYKEAIYYYGRAIQLFSQEYDAVDPVLRLAVLLLFACFEKRWGTFRSGRYHILHADRVVDLGLEKVLDSHYGSELIRTWIGIRGTYLIQHVPWGKSEFEAFVSRTGVFERPAVLSLLDGRNSAKVMQILPEATRISDLLFLAKVMGRDETSLFYRNWVAVMQDLGITGPPRELQSYDSQVFESKLTEYRMALDSWHEKLPLDELPVDCFTSKDIAYAEPGLHIRPLRFSSHQAAMTYAYYACAQLLCSLSFMNGVLHTLRDGPHRAARETLPEHIDIGVLLILRIMAGLSYEDCARLNHHDFGILRVLMLTSARTSSLAVLIWMERWVEGLQKTGVCQEADLPVELFLNTLQLVRKEREERHRLVIFVSSGITADSEKLEAYNRGGSSGSKDKLRGLLGIDLDTNKPFTYVIQVK